MTGAPAPVATSDEAGTGNGNRWRLPDGREGVQVEISGRQLRVVPINAAEPSGFGASVVAWLDLCTLLPSRYLRGAMPAHPLATRPAD